MSQNFETNISLRSICKYMQKLILFSDFCKNFQGKFFFKGLHQFSTINCTYSYKSLPLGIFLNSYPVKARCVHSKLLPISFQKNHSSSYSIKIVQQEMTLHLRSSLLPSHCGLNCALDGSLGINITSFQ